MRNHLIFLFLFLCAGLLAQERIALENPSFEDAPQAGKAPQGWDNCGPPDQTPPDVHPNDRPPYHFFGVNMRPDEGWAYLGMAVRENGTWESVGQKLATPLQANTGYLFSLYLARSEVYYSGSRGEIDFSRGAVLRIWGGNAPCEKTELLALTVPVDNARWLEYVFTLEPTQPWTHLAFEAYYDGDQPYNGHVLLDNCSDLAPLPKTLPREDLEAMDAEGLETVIFSTIDKFRDVGLLQDLTEVPHIGVCYKTHAFEKQVAESGLRRLVMNASFDELSSLIRSLEAIRLEKNLALLKETTRLSMLDSKKISPEEYQYFERADMTFRENEAEESIRSKRLEYIQLHRNEIIDELTGL